MKAKKPRKKPMQYQIVDDKASERLVLNEGRSSGVAFAFVKKEEDKITFSMPLSACKDYLNDKVWSERTGKPFTVYGMTTKKEGLFEGDKAYLVMAVVGTLGYPYGLGSKVVTPYLKQDEDEKLLEKNYELVQRFVNWFEDKFKLKDRTLIEKINPTQFLVTAPIFWTEATYRISLYAQLMRVAYKWDGEEDPVEYLKKNTTPDWNLLNRAQPNLDRMLKGTIPEQNLSAVSSPHSLGIIGFQFP